MSRHINVNPGHYKVAGRERQGEDIIQHEQKQAYTTQQADAMGDGVPPWEATRHSFASAQPEPEPARKMRKPGSKRRTSPAKRAAARKTTRKATRAKKPVRAASKPVRRRTAAKSVARPRRIKRSTRRR